jgi:cytosine/adenosine deaminase-related metal-dependent hydrolase
LDPEAELGYKENMHITIDGNLISYVGSELPSGFHGETIEGKNLLAIPGLVNGHTHSAEVYLKGTTDRVPLEVWLVQLDGTCGVYEPRDVYLSCILGAMEMLKTGATSVLDHLWVSPGLSTESLDAAMQAYTDIGIRAAVAPMADDDDLVVQYAKKRGYSLDDTFFAQRHDVRPNIDEQANIMETFFSSWHNSQNGRLQCLTGPSGIQWCSSDFFKQQCTLARKYNGMIHTHVLESDLQAKVCNEVLGKTGIEFLYDCGALGPDVSLAHCVWLTDKDIDILAETKTMVIHNPAANLKLGSGLAPIRKMLDKGVTVGIGTDGSASSDNQVVFEMLKLTGLIHNLSYKNADKWLSAREVIDMATLNGGPIMGLKDTLGRIKPDYLADIVLLNLDTPHLTPLNDAYKALVFCETGASVDTVIVNGKIVVKDGLLKTVSEKEILSEIRDTVKRRGNSCNYLSDEDVNKAIEAFTSFMEHCGRCSEE